MDCTDIYCPCPSHVTPETHVPVCPIHSTPLVRSEHPGYGFCTWGRGDGAGKVIRSHIGGQRIVAKTCTDWDLRRVELWRHRGIFDADDLPPANGWQPVEVPEEVTT